jgi:hypothetical protein
MKSQITCRHAAMTAVLAFTAIGAAASGCSPDIFDISVALADESFPIMFGNATGTIPSIACDPQNPGPCGAGQVIALNDGAGEAQIDVGCSAPTSQCYAEVDARLSYVVDVLRDESFTSKVARKTVTLVRMLDVAYTVPTNTTTFTVPQMDIYVGPAGTTTATDPGVYLVASVPAIPAGTTIVDQPGHLTIADGSPGRDLIEKNICGKTPFVFVVTLAPRLEAGAPVPAGQLEMRLQPLLGLGIR